MSRYKQYNLLLDPSDTEEAVLIEWLEDKRGNKHKNSYGALIKEALRLYIKTQKS